MVISLLVCISEAIGQYDVPYEPSSVVIVEKMLQMANVTKDDTVYDLGCGDGRIVITAVKEFGANGVGVDIDPVRISESKTNAIKEKVTKRIRFIQKNLFDADIHDATVVTLFLWPEVNLRLRPKLFRELKPGTRIVSHEHYMGEWLPEQTVKMNLDDWNHTIYLWILPANVSGTWEWTLSSGAGKRQYVLNLKQKFQEASGTLTVNGSTIPVTDVSIKGARLGFTAEETIGGQKTTLQFEGLVNGSSIGGSLISKAGSGSSKSNWKAQRDKSTIVPIDE